MCIKITSKVWTFIVNIWVNFATRTNPPDISLSIANIFQFGPKSSFIAPFHLVLGLIQDIWNVSADLDFGLTAMHVDYDDYFSLFIITLIDFSRFFYYKFRYNSEVTFIDDIITITTRITGFDIQICLIINIL